MKHTKGKIYLTTSDHYSIIPNVLVYSENDGLPNTELVYKYRLYPEREIIINDWLSYGSLIEIKK